MVANEWIFNLFGTSSEEIKQEVEEYYLPKIDELSSQNDYLKNILRQHNISFE